MAPKLSRVLFATGMISLGVLGLTFHDFALQWQPVPDNIPGREALAYLSAAVMLAGGIGLLIPRTASQATKLLFPYLALWVILLKVPKVMMAPLVEGNWLGLGEIAVLFAGGWTLFARLGGGTPGFASGDRGVRAARVLFGVALLPIGLSHIVYAEQTASFVPAWLPARTAWAYFTGAAHIAAGLGVIFSVRARLAATLEAWMLGAFTALVWIPVVVAAPRDQLSWTAITISWAITTGAAAVAAESGRVASHG